MEQKKILWILAIFSGFIVLILGFALIRFGPSTTKSPRLQQAMAITQAPVAKTSTNLDTYQSEKNAVDPDKWVRDPQNTPKFDSQIVPAAGNINLTIVNGDNATARYGTIDVSGLTKDDTKTSSVSMNQNIDIPGKIESATQKMNFESQTTKVESGSTTKTGSSSTTKTQTVSIQKPQTTTVIAKAKTTQPSSPVKKEVTKTVTEYWIQTGSFTSKLNAEKARKTLTDRALTAEIFTKDVSNATTYRVRIGPYASKTEATYWLGTIKETPSLSTSYISEVKTKK
ncbi:MAG TPA: SPOR domain-containing protein [Treponemataceae bacterium]|nr:SPOR domain-containing protein [Treponemataceae bacterium]